MMKVRKNSGTLIRFLCCLILVSINGFSQEVLYRQDILPPSPETSAFGKNVNIPVNYSTGTPQIGIPIYTLKSGMLDLPISLNYNASGIKVEDVATWVGLGWSLSAGGQIARSIRGMPDESLPYGYMMVPFNRTIRYMDSVIQSCGSIFGAYGTDVGGIVDDYFNYNRLDVEPDEYSFSIMGYSGNFYYNQDSSKFVLTPYQNIKIEGSPTAGYFVLTLPNGVKGYFGDCADCKETLLSGTTSSYIDGVSHAAVAVANAPYVNSWSITKLKDPAGRTIEFTYASETMISFGRGSEKFGHSLFDLSETYRTQSFYKQYLKKPVLAKVSSESGNVYFKRSSSQRLDIPDYFSENRSLDTIVITNTDDVHLRSFYFEYDYFLSPSYSMSAMLDIAGYAEQARRRLYLKSIYEKNESMALPPYKFTYSNILLPSRVSTSQDYWGYYNGKSNGNHIIPRIPQLPFFPTLPNANEIQQNLPLFSYFNSDGADRRVDTSYNQAGTLKKITYPSGGSTEYFYETNVSATTQNLNIYGGMEAPDMTVRIFNLNLMSNPIPANPPYPLYFSGSFHINIPLTKLKIIPQLQACTTYTDASCKLTVKLKSLPDSTLITTINTTNTITPQLPSGDYLFEVFIDGSPDDYPPIFDISAQWGERVDSLNFVVGGLRVKKIISSDSLGNSITRSFSYNYESSNESSGTLDGIPVYKVLERFCDSGGYSQYFTSNSTLPLSREGRTVRYRFVTEYYDTAKSSFKTNYSFTSGITDPGAICVGCESGRPLTYWDWQHSLLKKKEVFEKTPLGSYRILSSEENFYKSYKPDITDVGFYGVNPWYTYIAENWYITGINVKTYANASEWYLPDSTRTIIYSYPEGIQKELETGIKHYYNEHFMPFLSRSKDSKGRVIDNKTRYLVDYNDVSGYNIATLVNKHILSLPVKQEQSINGKIASGSIMKYNSLGQVIEGYVYGNSSLADTLSHNRNNILDGNYFLKTTLQYDANANLKQVKDYKTGPVTYLWDKRSNASMPFAYDPVAMIQNADSTSVAYTSFESASFGNWTFSGSVVTDATTPTGIKCLNLGGGTISKSGLNEGIIYILSYWSKNGNYAVTGSPIATQVKTLNGWTCYQYQFSGVSSLAISGTGLIDEIRLYPQSSLITTLTYKHGVGVSSQNDANNNITYYEYDDLGRLSVVRDENKNILKRNCYNYAGQLVDCGYGNLAAWKPISSSCEQNNGVNTGNMIVIEKDMNPYSATYNQTRNVMISNQQSCPLPPACVGVDKKLINGICETGTKVCTGNFRPPGQGWKHYYHYKWSDNSISETYIGEGLGCLEL